MWLNIWNRTRKNRFLLILTSPWVIGSVGLTLLLLFRPIDFEPFKLSVLSTNHTGDNISLWHDLDLDGNSELLEFRMSEQNPASVYVFDSGYFFVEILNLGGHWINRPVFTLDDWNRDGSPELYSLVRRNDSLFATQNGFMDHAGIQKRKFVTLLQSHRVDFTMTMHSMKLSDNNGDGSPDLVFVLSAGYQRQPRAVFAWDLLNDTIYRSPVSGANIPWGFEYFDINDDGIEEIFGYSSATNNYETEDTIPYRDDNSYLMIYTKDLEFLFKPVKIRGSQTSCRAIPFVRDGIPLCMVRTTNQRSTGDLPSLRLYTPDGNLLKEQSDPTTGTRNLGKMMIVNGNPFIIKNEGDQIIISDLEEDLNLYQKYKTGSEKYVYKGDLDSNGQEEFIIITRDGMFMEVFDDDFKPLCRTELQMALHPSEPSISHRYINGKLISTGIQISDNFLNIQFRMSNDYHWRILFYIGSYFVLVLFLSGLYKIFEYRIRKREEIKNRMMQLQLQTIMNQMNPHFTFNALNAVGVAILKDEKERAYDYLTQISEMIRGITRDAMIPYKTVREELEFVKQYLAIQKFRFSGSLSWRINVPEKIDLSMRIPKMLVHVFVENAFKHGICAENKEGVVDILLEESSENLIISIRDNGPGLGAKKRPGEKRSGNGLNILHEYLQLFKIQYGREITFTLENIFDSDGLVSGALAMIVIKK